MWVISVLLLQIAVIILGIRQEQRAGRWSWSKFAFALAFGAMECIIIVGPTLLLDMRSSYFIPAISAAFLVAALNFIWMILVARRWKLPGGRKGL